MDSDISDILGGPMSLNVRDSQSGWWTSLPFGAKLVFAALVFFILYAVFVRIRDIFLVWREKSYKLSMRRRHGIPDNDHRPFNVAYAAVLRSRLEGEEKARRARLQELIQDQQSAPPDQDIRQRNGYPRGASMRSLNPLRGTYEPDSVLSSMGPVNGFNPTRPLSASQLVVEEYYNPHPAVRIADPEIDNGPPKSSLTRRCGKYIDDEGNKHSHSDGDVLDYNYKETSKDENELRGDEEPEWILEHGSLRGWKRGHGDDHDEKGVEDLIHSRDKRQRKVSLDNSPHLMNEEMDIDEDDDELSTLRPFSRGKKRDRAEAESTFGGDEDESDSEVNLEQARRRHRKRRTYAKRKSDVGVSSRGTKRDRELAEDESEGGNEDDISLTASRKKRGKKAARALQQDHLNDMSLDESPPRGRAGRSVGEEWESNGVKYKIGPAGQRLRQTLVRKERQKFPMPEDSQHPDRQANFEVYVETWLNEKEYREAKDKQLLAWQDLSKPSAEPQTPTLESPEQVPPVAGKDLLWNLTSGSTQPGMSTPRQLSPPTTPQARQRNTDSSASSTAPNIGLRINPFANPPPASKRISAVRRPSSFKSDGTSIIPPSPVGSIAHSLSDSTNNSPRHKAFSKWEKQDLEAKAMMKMRQANRLKEEENQEKLKKEKETAAAASKALPTITITKVDDAKPTETTQTSSFSAKLPAADVTKKDVSKPLFAAGPAKETNQPPLFAPTTSLPPAKPPTTLSPATSGGAQTTNLFGSKPDQLTSFVSFGPSSSASASSSTFPATSAPAPANPGIPTSNPTFSLGTTPFQTQPAQTSQASEKKSEPATGGSLLSRLAPPSAFNPAAQVTQPSRAASPFAFSKPTATEASKTTSVFGNSTPQTTFQPPLSQSSTASTGPKFDFGFSKSPAGGATTSSSTATSGPFATKPATNLAFTTSPNSADKGSTTTSNTTPTPTNASTVPPKFNFSIPSSSSSNPSTLKTNGIAASTVTSSAATQSAFVFGSRPAEETRTTSVPAMLPLGASGAQTTAATPSTTSAAPAQSSFGALGAKPNGASMTAHVQPVFGTQPAVPSTTNTPEQSTSAFGTKPADTSSTHSVFGAQSTAGFFASAPTQSAFAVGASSAPSSTSSTFGSGTTFGSKPNGHPSAPAPVQQTLGGGLGGLNTTSTSLPFFAFGKPAAVTSAAPSAGSNNSKPIFSFGIPAAPSSSTTPLMTPSATPVPSTTAATAGAPSASGTSTFGPSSSNTFTFGSGTKTSTTPAQTSTDSPFGNSVFGFGTSGNAFSGFGKTPAPTGQQ